MREQLTAAALCALLAGCAAAPPRVASSDDGAAADDGQRRRECDAARAEIRRTVAERFVACREDFECEPLGAALSGDCQTAAGPAFRSRRESAAREVAERCGALPEPESRCPALVGACSGGRCVARPPQPSEGSCRTARAALARRVAEVSAPCAADDGCYYTGRLREESRREEHGVEAACTDPRSGQSPVPLLAACRTGRCALVSDGGDLPGPFERRELRPPRGARPQDPGCLGRSVQLPRGFESRVGKLAVRFAVERDGSLGEFAFPGQRVAPPVSEAVSQGIRGCRWLPGSDALGRPIRVWITVPLSFQR